MAYSPKKVSNKFIYLTSMRGNRPMLINLDYIDEIAPYNKNDCPHMSGNTGTILWSSKAGVTSYWVREDFNEVMRMIGI